MIPKVTPLPQKSHFAIHCTSHPIEYHSSITLYKRFDIIANISKKSKYFFLKISFFQKKIAILVFRRYNEEEITMR